MYSWCSKAVSTVTETPSGTNKCTNREDQCHDVSETCGSQHKQHQINSNSKWCHWKCSQKSNTMANKDKGTDQVKPKGQWKNQCSSTFLTAAAEEFSRKEVDRLSGEVKLDTKVNGHYRCTEYHRESKDKWPQVSDILCLLDVRIEGDTG